MSVQDAEPVCGEADGTGLNSGSGWLWGAGEVGEGLHWQSEERGSSEGAPGRAWLTPVLHPLRVAGLSGLALDRCLSWELGEAALWVSHDLPSATTRDHPEVAGGLSLSAVPHLPPPVLEGGGAGRLHIELVAAPHSLQGLTRWESSGASEGAAERVTLEAWVRVAESGLLWGRISEVGREVLMVDLLGVYCV